MSEQTIAYVALGSNMGDRLATLRRAVAELARRDGIRIDPGGIASLWETEPVGGPPGQQAYFNTAIRVHTALGPEQLLQSFLDVEHELGRTRSAPGESRVIDLDMLFYDVLVWNSPSLTLPHPRMHERRFMLEPLAEIGGEIVHPLHKRTIRELRDELLRLPNQFANRIMGPDWARDLIA